MPDGCGHVPFVPPLLGRVDVHAPQFPVVAVARVLVALHLEGVVLDVVDGRQDDPLMVLFYSGQHRLGPDHNANTLIKYKTQTQQQHKVSELLTNVNQGVLCFVFMNPL